MDNSTYWFFEKFMGDNFCLLYDGDINDDITEKIIDLSESHFENEEGFSETKKKVSFLLAECFQNIIRHGGERNVKHPKNINSGFFLTRNIENVYFITSGNLIKNENIDDLKEQLDKINGLDKNSLRALYVDILANKNFSEKGGAGLGLIKIARKSNQKIEFVFNDFDESHSVFYNQIVLKSSKDKLESDNDNGFYISEAINYHKKMLDEGVLIIQKGDFSHSTILPVLEILEKNLPNLFTRSHTRKNAYHVLVELLQNISKYAVEKDGKKEGVFLIRKKGEHFIIGAGNFVEEFHIEALKLQIKLLNSLPKEEVKNRYLAALTGKGKDKKGGALIELIEIARRSKDSITYSFIEPKPGVFFFTISVTI